MTDCAKLSELDAAEKDRFTGYNLPMAKLDDGFEYYIVGVHPYFYNQPMVWQTPAFQIGFDSVGGHSSPLFSEPAPSVRARAKVKAVATSQPEILEL